MLITDFSDYRDYLKSILDKRKEANPRYSLRAFARDLQIESSWLSEIFRSKKGLSVESAQRIADLLQLSPAEQSYFCTLVQLSHARSSRAKKAAKEKLAKHLLLANAYKVIQEDVFSLVSEWHHFGILELTTLMRFKPDFQWIAQILEISDKEAQSAIERLLRLGLLQQTSDGQIKKSHEKLTTTLDQPSQAIKTFHQQIISKSIDALKQQELTDREYFSTIVPTSKSKLKEAKERIRNFRQELCAYLESGEKDTLYCLSAQLFELTPKKQLEL